MLTFIEWAIVTFTLYCFWYILSGLVGGVMAFVIIFIIITSNGEKFI